MFKTASAENKEPKEHAAEGIDNLKEVERELRAQKKIKIMIPSTETQHEPVPVQINGYAFLIERDKEVLVPESVVEVLRNAQFTTYKQIKREDGEGNQMIPLTSLRFAFQILP
jgi:hypothetical protein